LADVGVFAAVGAAEAALEDDGVDAGDDAVNGFVIVLAGDGADRTIDAADTGTIKCAGNMRQLYFGSCELRCKEKGEKALHASLKPERGRGCLLLIIYCIIVRV
jgi:hypothetical protein